MTPMGLSFILVKFLFFMHVSYVFNFCNNKFLSIFSSFTIKTKSSLLCVMKMKQQIMNKYIHSSNNFMFGDATLCLVLQFHVCFNLKLFHITISRINPSNKHESKHKKKRAETFAENSRKWKQFLGIFSRSSNSFDRYLKWSSAVPD